MAFTQVPVTGTIKLPSNNSPLAGAIVTFTLNTGISDGTTFLAPTPVQAVADSNGAISVTLAANDDTATQPTGTFYQVVISAPSAPFVPLDTFNIIVPKADVAGVNLFSLATLLNPASVSAFVSQIIAGTGVTLTPAGGTGVVRIDSAGSANGTVVSAAGTVSHPTELLDATSAAFTRTLPTAVGFTGEYNLVAVTTGLNVVTIATTSGQTITPPVAAAASTISLGTPTSGATYTAVTLVSDGSNWRII